MKGEVSIMAKAQTTAKKPAAKAAASTPRKSLAPTTADNHLPANHASESTHASGEPLNTTKVLVKVPKPFKLRGDDSVVHEMPDGVYSTEQWKADHWYSKAHGLTRFTPEK
jgi:hypothetical protein